MIDLVRSAYVHVPFCRHRCGYCNFTLVAGRDDLVESYLRAIELELSSLTSPRPVDTLFLGGGTPSHLGSADLARLLSIIRHWLPLDDGGEFSIECNPNDLTADLVQVMADAGVNRVSLGVQSFDSDKLRVLERDHDAADVEESVRLAKDHIPWLSLDLIFGVPGENVTDWKEDLRRAIALGVQHVSTYGLTIEKGTLFFNRRMHGELKTLDESDELAMYLAGIELLTRSGFEHYEISNFAQPGFRCRHNETYWSGSSFYAFGPGAARFVGGVREINHRSVVTYIKRMLNGHTAVAETDRLPAEDRARELFIVGMRRLEGVDRMVFAELTGFSVDELFSEELLIQVKAGNLVDDGTVVKLSAQGLPVSDAIWPDFLRV